MTNVKASVPLDKFWAVSESTAKGCFLVNISLANRYRQRVWFIEIGGLKIKKTILCLFPFILYTQKKMEIRSNNFFPAPDNIIKDIGEWCPGTKRIPDFESGPLVSLFPYEASQEALTCGRSVANPKNTIDSRAKWAELTRDVINSLIYFRSIPVIPTEMPENIGN